MIYIENIVDISFLINILVVWTFIRVLGIHKYIYIYICMYVCMYAYSHTHQIHNISKLVK